MVKKTIRKKLNVVIIISSGRGGSTVLHQLLAMHSQVMWFSKLANKFQNKPYMNKLVILLTQLPFCGAYFTKKLRPSEPYELWDYYHKGFSRPFRDLTKDDVRPSSKKNLLNYYSRCLTRKRDYLLLKVTGWPRIGFLQELFPDAKFIYINRDGRAVANSYLNIDFWKGWAGPWNWRYGLLSEENQKLWEKHDKSFVCLAGILWKMHIDAVETTKKQANNWHELTYEDLCKNTKQEMEKILEYAGLSKNKTYMKKVDNFKLKNSNYKWKKDLTKKQQTILQETIGTELKRCGYL